MSLLTYLCSVFGLPSSRKDDALLLGKQHRMHTATIISIPSISQSAFNSLHSTVFLILVLGFM